MEGFEGELDDLRQSEIVGLVKFVTILIKPAGLVTRLGGLVTVNAMIPVRGDYFKSELKWRLSLFQNPACTFNSILIPFFCEFQMY